MQPTHKLPSPILLNCLKHHLGFIVDRIQHFKPTDGSKNGFISDLQQLGQSRIDLYTGALDTLEISKNIVDELGREGRFSKKKYYEWISKGRKRYQLMQLSDQSIWTFLKGEDLKRYVHIHPARNSKHNLSVNANGLKTAIAVMAWAGAQGGDATDLAYINHVRVNHLKLPPLKRFLAKKGLGTLIELIRNRAQSI